MVSTSVRDSVAGAVWIYLSNVIAALGGFAFWVIMARVAGLKALGVASAIVSAASIATTFVSAGLGIAVVREVASRDYEAFWASLAVSIGLGLAASALATVFASLLGVGSSYLCSLLAFLSVLSLASLSSLRGFRRFRGLALASLASTAAKIGTGLAVALAGERFLAPLVGYVAYPLVASVASLAMVLPLSRGVGLRLGEVKRVIVYTYTNYPAVFSGQLTIMLNVYLYALLSHRMVSTGALYLSFAVALAISMIPGALLGASLPISIKSGSSSISESARIGLAMAIPVVAFVVAAPSAVLSVIARGSSIASTCLALLAFSVPPAVIVSTAINELNRVGNARGIAAIGIARLLTLLATLPALTKLMGVDGAALSYFLSTCAPIPYAIKRVDTGRELLKCWLAAAPAMATYLALGSNILAALAISLASVAMLRALRVATLLDAKMVASVVLSELLSIKRARERTS